MFTHKRGSEFTVRFVGALMALALMAGLALVPATTVYADDGTGGEKPAQGGQLLERALQRERRMLERQADQLEKAGELADKAQERIDELKSQGKDTAALETALAAFRQQVATAQTAHDKAGSILEAHAGFDADGHVTDREQARQTIKDARQSLGEAQRTLRQAVRDARKALREYRRTHQ